MGGSVKKWTTLSKPTSLMPIQGQQSSYHLSNQWKFDEDFVEYDIFEIAGLIEGDNLVYLSPLFTTFSIFHVWFNISFNF